MIWIDRLLPLAIGTFKRGTWPLIKARLDNKLLGTFTPFTTKCGFDISNKYQLMAWWDLGIEEGAFKIWPEHMPDNPVIYDIGANFGVFGWLCRQRWPNATIIGFEPNPTWAEICINLGCYNRVFNIALGDCSEQVQLDVTDKWGSASINGYRKGLDGGIDRSFPVQCLRLSEFENDISKPDFIKVDVDGAEVEVVRGGKETFKQAKYALIEVCKDEFNVARICSMLNKGYYKTGDYLFI